MMKMILLSAISVAAILAGCSGRSVSTAQSVTASPVSTQAPQCSVCPVQEETAVNIIPTDTTTFRDLFKEAWESGSLAFSNGYSAGIDNGNMHAGANDTADYEYYPLTEDASTRLYVLWDNSDSAYRASSVSPYFYTGNTRAAVNVQRYQKIHAMETDAQYINAEGADGFSRTFIEELCEKNSCKLEELAVYITKVDGREDRKLVTYWKPSGGSAWYDGQPWSEIKAAFPD